METGGPLLYLQEPATCTYSESDGDHAFSFCFLNIHFNIIIILVDNIKCLCRRNRYCQVNHSQN